MYLNEKAWEVQQEDQYAVRKALIRFLQIYKALANDFHLINIYVPENEELYLRSTAYSIGKWLSETDIEYKRLYLSFLQKRITYREEDEYEVIYEKEILKGGTEAVLNDSFLISVCFNESWEKDSITAQFFSLLDMREQTIIIDNVFYKEQLYREPIYRKLKSTREIKVYSYSDLWKRREELFPHLRFCPSVEKDFGKLEKLYLGQVIKKLMELEEYSAGNSGLKFNPDLLTKTTPEGESTLQKYRKQHTFCDDDGTEYLASWHIRFTGIPGRIFFIPEYKNDCILICYVGEKLPNTTYPA